MRLRVDFGMSGGHKEVNWWRQLSDFPTCVLYDNQRWEWISYGEDPNKIYDKILMFGHMSLNDPRWFQCKEFEEMFGYSGRSSCECGSIHSSAPQFHMFYCPMWRKV